MGRAIKIFTLLVLAFLLVISTGLIIASFHEPDNPRGLFFGGLGLWTLALLTFLAVLNAAKFRWAFKILAAFIFFVYSGYVIIMLVKTPQPFLVSPISILLVLMLYRPHTHAGKIGFTVAIIALMITTFILAIRGGHIPSSAEPNLGNALCGWLFYGLPALIYLRKSPLTKTEQTQKPDWPAFDDYAKAITRWTKPDGTNRVYLIARNTGTFGSMHEWFSEDPLEMCWLGTGIAGSIYESEAIAIREITAEHPWVTQVRAELPPADQ